MFWCQNWFCCTDRTSIKYVAFNCNGNRIMLVNILNRLSWLMEWFIMQVVGHISLIRRGRLYSSCVRSSMLHGSETWPARKENEVALQRAEMRMVRWMCNVKVKDRVPSKEFRERLGIDDIILILQQNRLWWYGHVLQKIDNDWVKKCMEY